MKGRLNPLSWLALLVAFLVLVFRSHSQAQYVWLVAVLLGTVYVMHVPLSSVWRRMKMVVTLLPVMFLFYLILSLILSTEPFEETAAAASVSTGRILLMVLTVSSFLEVTRPMEVLDSVRTLWRRLNIPFRPVEDFFQLLYLSLRFFPMLKEEIVSVTSMESALSLKTDPSRVNRIRQTSRYLPGLISNSLHRADNIAVSMETRHYGRVFPRGVAHPVPFRVADVALPILLSVLIGGHAALAQL